MSVLFWILRRILFMIPVVFLVTLGTAALTDLMPGSPAAIILGSAATPKQVAILNHEYGFDQPLIVRYGHWVWNALRGDLGNSILTGRPVSVDIVHRIGVTGELALYALLIALIAAVPLAVISAGRPGSLVDRVMQGAASVSMSIPSYVLSVALVFAFAVTLRFFPVTGWVSITQNVGQNLKYALLPALALAIGEFGIFYRVLRGDVMTTLQQDFVLSARSKGLTRGYVLFRHALRPSLFSLVTVAGLSLGRLLGGAVIVEFFFAIPGLGNLALNSIPYKDIPTIQGVVSVIAVIYVIVNVLVDFTVTVIDPRVQRG